MNQTKCMRRGVVSILGLMACCGLAHAQEQSLGIKAAFPDGLFLVRARIKEAARREREATRATLVIEHVYAGPDNLKGRSFVAQTSGPHIGSTFRPEPGRYIHFLYPGVEGLWWIRRDTQPPGFRINDKQPPKHDPDRLAPVLDAPTLNAYKIKAFPYQNNRFGGDYEEGLDWAEAVEDVYRAKSDEARGDMLAQLAARARPPISDWAAAVLACAVSPPVPGFNGAMRHEPSADIVRAYRAKADANLSASARLVLDRLLCAIDARAWPGSEPRAALFGGALTANDADAFGSACLRMLDALSTKEMDLDFYTKTLDPVLAKGNKLPKEKQWWLGRTLREARWQTGATSLLDATEYGKRVTKHFAWLKRHLGTTKSPILRAHAAAGFKSLGFYAPHHADELRPLCGKDAVARRELDFALNVHEWQENDAAARRAAHQFGPAILAKNGPYHVAWPFYTGGLPVGKGKTRELSMVDTLLGLRLQLPRWHPAGLSDQVSRCKLWELRAALTPDPVLKQLAEKVTNDSSLLYVVHLFRPGERELALLVRVERGTGSVVGFYGALEKRRNPDEKLIRETVAAFVKAHNAKEPKAIQALLGPKWCHGGYREYKIVGDNGKGPYPADVDIGPYGTPARPWAGGPTAKALPKKLPADVAQIVRYDDQRRALFIEPNSLKKLDQHMVGDRYVVFLGAQPDAAKSLLVTVEKGRVRIAGTLRGLQ